MKLDPGDTDYLLLSAEMTESIDSIELFSNGITGRYYFMSYVVQEMKDGKFDVAMAVHNAKWNFGDDIQGTDK